MPPTSVQFWERVHAAALATPDECRNWAMQISKVASPESMQDSSKLAAELIRLGKITSFQANVLFANLPIPLSFGPYRITESLESKLGPNWLLAVDSTRTKRNSRWCYLLTPQNMLRPEVQNWPPSLELGDKQVSVSHPSVDKWLFSGVDNNCFVSFCEALDGQALTSFLIDRPLSWTESVSMVEQIAAGLQKMHDAGIVHGCICTDAVWCGSDGEFLLRRDPVFPPANPYVQSRYSVLTSSRDVPLSIAAPELTLSSAAASLQSDLYALGCVWFKSLTCSSPYGDIQRDTPQAWANAHATQPMRTLRPTELPLPLQQCLAHLLAKNPSARFNSASELIRAIEFAIEQPEKQPVGFNPREKASDAAVVIVDKPVPTISLPPSPEPVKAPSSPVNSKRVKPVPQKPLPPSTPSVSPAAIESVPVLMQPEPAKDKKVARVATPIANQTPNSEVVVSSVSGENREKQNGGDEELIASELVNPAEETVEPITQSSHASVGTIESTHLPVAPVSKTTLPSKLTVSSSAPPIAKVAQAKKKKSLGAKQSGVKKKSKKKKKPVWLMPAMLVGACLVFGAIITVLVQSGGSKVAVAPPPGQGSVNPPNTVKEAGNSNSLGSSSSGLGMDGGSGEASLRKPVDSVSEFFAVETDDGKLLWAPPQAGSPYSLEMFPAGVEAMVFVTGNLWQHRGVASGIGKWWVGVQPELAKLISSLPLLNDDRIQSVGIALFPSKTPGVPQAVFRITFAQPVSIESVMQPVSGYSLQIFDPKNNAKKGLWSNEALSNPIGIMMDEMQTDGGSMIKRAVVGPQELLATLPELNGGTAPLRRQMETLLKSTDSRADLTILFAPSFLFGDGRELLGATPKMQAVLREVIDESMQAVALTTTFEPRWYTELRMLSADTKDAGKFAASLKSSLLGVPDEFEKGLASGNGLHPYWRALALRYPQMMRAFNRYGRFGLEDGQVVVNTYLPTDAIGNVAVASWMALQNAAIDSSIAVATASKPAMKPQLKSIEEILESKINIGFDQESLESALQLISSELVESVLAGSPFSMAINGTAFQKEGITRNQQVRAFKQKDIPLRAVLTDLVRRANPVTTVQSPTEVNQKVVWVILDDADRPGQKKIELTTRNWAEANKVALPREFVAE